MIEIDKVLNTILNESIELPKVLVQGLTNNSSKVKKGYIFLLLKERIMMEMTSLKMHLKTELA